MSENQSTQDPQEQEFEPMTHQGARIAAFCFVALILFFAIARPSMIGEFSSTRMTVAGGGVLLLVMGSALAFLGRLGRALVSAFVWVCLVLFLIELFFSSSGRDDFDETRFFFILILASAAGAVLFLRKATKSIGAPPEFEGSELTWERFTSIAPIGRSLGLVIASFVIPSLIPLMGSGPDAGMAAGLVWAAILATAVLVAFLDATKYLIFRRKANNRTCHEDKNPTPPASQAVPGGPQAPQARAASAELQSLGKHQIMTNDLIDEIGIDNKGRLYVRPRQYSFKYIYREAMEVHWNEDEGCLYGPLPRRWSYLQWYDQIIKAAHEQGVNLRLHAETIWSDVPGDLKDEILTTNRNA